MSEPTIGETIAAALEWRLAGGGFPPPEVARLPVEDQQLLWAGADELYEAIADKVRGLEAGGNTDV